MGWIVPAQLLTLESSSVTEAHECAFGRRSVNLDELMTHPDQGIQFSGKEFQQRLVDKQIM